MEQERAAFSFDYLLLHCLAGTHFFISNTMLKVAKNQTKVTQYPEAKLLLFEDYLLFSTTLSSKSNKVYSKIVQNSKCVCFNEIISLIIMKMKMKMKKRSQRYDINRLRRSHGQKYTKYKRCLTMMMFICIQQHLSNIWSSNHEKVKQHWSLIEKKALLIKKSVIITKHFLFLIYTFPCIWQSNRRRHNLWHFR